MASLVGLHRVIEPAGVLPQAALKLNNSPGIGSDEVRISIERLNLDAASFRQLATKHAGDGAAVKAEVLAIIEARGKMQNPVTGSGGMLIGTVDAVGPTSPLGLTAGITTAGFISCISIHHHARGERPQLPPTGRGCRTRVPAEARPRGPPPSR